MSTTHNHTNSLINASSPYLLQHAHNPVNWQEWGDEAFAKAKAEDKLVLVSIGYSACHWCHVMERETFEQEASADVMNKFFVCIKVDREERPDVDQIYMDAINLMTGRGGWPLNVFCLPDGRPIHGGTYFKNEDWNQLLFQLEDFYKNRKPEALEYATKLTKGISEYDLIPKQTTPANFTKQDLDTMYTDWSDNFDWEEGGNNRAPKFPLPVNYNFLLNYAVAAKHEKANEFVHFTLAKMANGGIYDQLGGGFARYSVDKHWFAPHFEKMLYDNGQLVSLYSDAYLDGNNPQYRQVVEETLAFIKRELTDKNGGFYSALDADSEGEEGKFYVWTKAEIDTILGTDAELFCQYYNVEEGGNWEHGNNILCVTETNLETKAKLQAAITKLMAERDKRIRPGLDDKIITSWNALMLKGYADAYRVFRKEEYLEAALKNLSFIKNNMLVDGVLHRIYKDGKTTINGFLEDYAYLIDALISLYQVTANESHLNFAKELTEDTLREFYDEQTGFFFFTPNSGEKLVARKTDSTDDVTPAANSTMCKNLYTLGYYFSNIDYENKANQMLNNIAAKVKQHTPWYSGWAYMALVKAYGFNQLVITGNDTTSQQTALQRRLLPATIYAYDVDGSSQLPLVQNKSQENKTLIYHCIDKTCLAPVVEVQDLKL